MAYLDSDLGSPVTTRPRFEWRGKTLLITGGTGTFGQAFTRYLLEHEDVAALRILSRDELKQWEFARRVRDERLRFFLGDVRDRDRLLRAFDGVDVVIHAAALKQVPACEYNPFEAVKTNIVGAANVIDAAIERGVERLIAISTDKAANPVNLYGATKLCAEKLFVHGNAYAGSHPTRFSVVRFGNVVGSRGSVIPVFLEQRATGTITLTDRRMSRFWITVGQAVDFVRMAIAAMRGGEIFVPKLPSVRMLDVASAVAPACAIREIGIRPGEKLHEVLVTPEESRHTFDIDSYFLIKPQHPWWPEHGNGAGTPMAPESVYSSDGNKWWLSRADIARSIPEALSDARHFEEENVPAGAA